MCLPVVLAASCGLHGFGCAAGTWKTGQDLAVAVESPQSSGEGPLLRVYYPTEFLAGSIVLQLKLDERWCRALPNGAYVEMSVAAGDHVLAARDIALNFAVRPGEVVYVRARESHWSGRDELARVAPEIGKRESLAARLAENTDLPEFTCDSWPPIFNDPAASGLSDAQVAILHSVNGPWGDCNQRNCTYQVYQLRRADDGKLLYTEPPSDHPYRYLGRVYHFRLSPGRYEITYQTDARTGQKRVTRTDVVELKAGHVYRARQQFECHGLEALFRAGCNGHWTASALYADGTVWIEDTTTNEIVAGEKWY